MLIASRLAALPRDARDTLFLLAVIALIVLPQVSHLPWWASVFTAIVLLWRGWLALQAQPLPGRGWRLALLAAMLVATYATHRTLLGRDAGVTLVVMLLALKTLELRARRDAFVVFFLGFFAMLTNFFYSQSLLTALAMLLALLGLLTALVNAHMPVGRPPLARAARTAGWMALAGAPVMLALFMLFPRLAPLWGTPGDALAGRTGLSDSMRVGTIARLALDDGVVARIRFDGAPPPQSQLYFRGPVLSQFDGHEWTAAAPWPHATPGSNLRVQGEPVRYQVTLEPTHRSLLPTLEVTPDAPTGAGLEPLATSDLQWLVRGPIRDRVRYRARSYTHFQSGPERPVPALQADVALPPGSNPRTVAWAAQLRADPALAAGGTPAFVQAALTRLRTGGYTYTLDPGVYGQNTADEFWFDRREGFCEHIASSFVILMRALGIPARIVTGYQGGERNPVDGDWTLRHSDAHAWAEVWQPGRGWLRVGGARAHQPGPAAAATAGPAGRHVRRHQPGLSAWRARHLGSDQQRLEPVGAELHAKPPVRSPEETGLRLAERGRVGLCAFVPADRRQPAWRRLDVLGAQPRRPLAAPVGAGAHAPGARRTGAARQHPAAQHGAPGQRALGRRRRAAARLAAAAGSAALRAAIARLAGAAARTVAARHLATGARALSAARAQSRHVASSLDRYRFDSCSRNVDASYSPKGL